ncbi:unnamed protein product [Blepharisma stoltei]|uniref:Uncharacterized protein n=1 Tax=Blepharisma stoltei TaxID=1481888 RepID=A0AAU9IYB9_9CILI|nr:unnamed protein product [Blepharisma stoltei]
MDRDTLIDEAPTYMSQDEVQNMVQSFQSALGIFTDELEQLRKDNDELHTKLQYESTRDVILSEGQEKINIKYQKVKTELESCNEQINILETALNHGRDLALSAGRAEMYRQYANQIFERTSQEGVNNEITEFIMNLEREIYNLEIENKRSKEVNQKLRNDIGIAFEEEKSNHRCKNCKKEFVPKQNRDGECFYHPGKMKYYSCKGCGEDAYYNCCNKCIKCSPGCRTGKHIAI